jgi:hypothetical protein
VIAHIAIRLFCDESLISILTACPCSSGALPLFKFHGKSCICKHVIAMGFIALKRYLLLIAPNLNSKYRQNYCWQGKEMQT